MGILSQWAAWDGIGIGGHAAWVLKEYVYHDSELELHEDIQNTTADGSPMVFYAFASLQFATCFCKLLALIQLRCLVRHSQFKYCELFHTKTRHFIRD